MFVMFLFELTDNSTSGIRDEVLTNILANQSEPLILANQSADYNNYPAKEPVLSRGTN